MTNQTTQNTEATSNNGERKQPTYVAKVRHGKGEGATYERIGVAWENENGSLYIKLHGTQVVSAFTLYELEPRDQETEDQEAGE